VCTAALLCVAGAAFAGELERQGPLAKLPSKPGPHIAKIQAMGDNAWLDIGAPKPDPKWGAGRGRSWCAQMSYAADLRGAFHTGEGVHAYVKQDGYYMDDVFFYDLNAHAWICIYPGTKAGPDQGLRIGEKGFFVDQAGDLVMVAPLAHNYGGTIYDSDRKKLVVMPNQFLMNWWAPRKLPQAAKLLPEGRAKLKGKQFSPWFWNTVTGKFERDEAKGPGPGDTVGRGIVTIYLPSIRKIFIRDQRGRNWLYDPDKKAWSAAAKGPDAKTSAGMVACYDTKRDRVILPTGYRVDPGWFAYDVKANKWLDLKPKGGGKTTDQNASCVTYDTANDVVILIQHHRKSPQRGMFVYDCATNAWLNDKPITLPAKFGGTAAFYDPVNNVHYYYQAYDSHPKGKFWLYRYKRAAKETKE
jgi:hypothetical protein